MVGISIIPVSVMADGAEEVTQTRLMNGGFEIPAVTNADATAIGSYSWVVRTAEYLNEKANERSNTDFYWKTTAYDTAATPDGKIEIGFEGNYGGYGVTPKEGNQFAELCGQDQSSLYQNLKTEPGSIFNWNISHAARRSTAPESMALFIGEKQSSSLRKPAKGIDANNDIFMWMAQLLKDTNLIDLTQKSDTEPIPFTVYSKPDINVQTEGLSTNANDEKYYRNYFSLTKTDNISKEWKCWILTTEKNDGWVSYSGTYDVPADQTETTFAFTALTGTKNNQPYINEGNLLDNVVFHTSYLLHVSTTAGGLGTVSMVKSDAEDEELASVTSETEHTAYYEDGTLIKITAAPEKNYTFIGAYIDRTFHKAADFIDNSYTVTMDRARYVQLVYAKDHTVIFDPNGGSYEKSQTNTEITMNADNSEYNSHAAVHYDPNIKFIGWYVGRFPSYYIADGEPAELLGALIDAETNIRYVPTDTNQGQLETDYYYTYGDTTTKRTFATDASSGLTFIAQWEYNQIARAMTKERTAIEYAESSKGGTVQITDLRGSTSATTRTIETLDENGAVVTDGGGKRSSGYGRLADTVTMTAVTNEGYTFLGWYDENGDRLSTSTMYTYEVDQVHNIEARFSGIFTYPYLSFVSQNAEANTNDPIFGLGSHVRVGDNVVSDYGGVGRTDYGNTISTGFSTILTFNNIAFSHCIWTISLPAIDDGKDTRGNPMYIKSSSNPSNMTKVLADADNVTYNKGTIYKVNNSTEKEVKLLGQLPTISGEGQVVFGIIIDNLYAPGASAALEMLPTDSTIPNDAIDITGTYTATTDDGYDFYDENSTK